MRHVYLFSIKNRFSFFKLLVYQLMDLYKDSATELVLSVYDFSSEDADIVKFLDSIEVKYYFSSEDGAFNLGKGWNCAANRKEIGENDLLIFIVNDLDIKNPKLINYVSSNTIPMYQVWVPEHLTELEDGRVLHGGGAALWTAYKKDFKKIGNIPESESWSDAGGDEHIGEDDKFINMARDAGYAVLRDRSTLFVSKFHERDLSDPWYANSKCMKHRYIKNNGNHPSWWRVVGELDE